MKIYTSSSPNLIEFLSIDQTNIFLLIKRHSLFRLKYLLFLFLFCFSINSTGQISVTVTGNTNTTPNLAASYTSLANAIAALNTVTALNGPVTFNLPAGSTETSTSQLSITLNGNINFAITFQKSGGGANPKLTRTDAGTNTTSTEGGLGDGIIRITSTDNIHFNGLDISASNQGIEYGYFIFKTTINACKTLSIKNCDISLTKGTNAFGAGIYVSNGPSTVSSATGVSVSTSGGQTDGVTITGNTISNVHTGILCRGFNTSNPDLNLVIGGSGVGNVIQNFGGGSATSAYGVSILNNINSSVTFNTINNAGGGGTAHASSLSGIRFTSTTGAIVASNNTITMTTSGTSDVQWIYNNSSQTSYNFSNNILAGSIAATTTSYLIYGSSSTQTFTVSGNSTTGTIVKTGASGILYGFFNNGNPSSGTSSITGNTFSNITISGTSDFTGIDITTGSGHNAVINSNTIENIIVPGIFVGIDLSGATGNCNGNIITSITGGGAATGILCGNSSQNVFDNKINSITSSGGAAVKGIERGLGNNNNPNIYNNKICDLSGTHASSTVTGISNTFGSTNIYNNLIGNLTAPNATGTLAVVGISLTSLGSSTNIIVDYNTIFLNASGSGNFGSRGIYHTQSSSPTTANLTMRNNIIYNNSTASGLGVTAAYGRSSTGNQNYNDVSDWNLLWGGTPSSSNLLFHNLNGFSTLSDFKNAVAPREQNSQTENVSFLSTSCLSADFLKYNPSSGTIVESGGRNVGGITTDFIGTIRQGNVGYSGSGTFPDLGAWELNGTPLCSGSPALANALVGSSSSTCVNDSFLLSLDIAFNYAYTFQWEKSITGPSSGFTPISGATRSTLTVNTTETAWYRCAVTCISSALTTVSNSVQITIANSPLSGVYIINSAGGGNYLSIASAVADLNCRGINGPVTFNVASGHTETSTSEIIITATGSSTNPIIFQGTGVHPLISRTDGGTNIPTLLGGAGDAIITLKGSDYITFDRIDLSATDQGIDYGYYTHKPDGMNGCQNITIKNCTINLTKGTNQFNTGIFISNGPTSISSSSGVVVTANSGRNENIILTGNTIRNVQVGINCQGYQSASLGLLFDQNITIGSIGSGNENTIENFGGSNTGFANAIRAVQVNNLNIENNIIDNSGGGGTVHTGSLAGIQYSASGIINTNNNTITMNSSGTAGVFWIFETGRSSPIMNTNNNVFAGNIAATSTSYFIDNSFAEDSPIITVNGNMVSGTINKTGASGQLIGYDFINTPTGGTSTITNNNFSNIIHSGTSTFTGIRQNTGVAHSSTVTGNTLSNITCPGTFIGIDFKNNPGSCSQNIISNISCGAAATGILAGSATTTGTQNISQNSISSISSTGAFLVTGIESAASGTGAISNLTKNKICSLSGTNASSTVFGLTVTAGKTTNVNNNLIGNLTAPSATGTDAVRGISITSATTSSSNTIDFNSIYLNASGAGNFGSTGIFNTTTSSAILTLRNNIVYNGSSPSGTGLTVAYRRSSTSVTNYSASSNNNLFWAGTPASNRLIFSNGTNNFEQLSDYKTYIITPDQSSVTENVPFLTTTCGSNDFLKYDQGTIVESGGFNISGITDDYSGTIRQGNPGYLGTGTAPDLGAWELEGTLPGSCSGAPAASTAQTSNANPACQNVSFNLSLDVLFGFGHTYQWEVSTTGPLSGFSPIPGAVNATLSTTTIATSWFRCAVTCTASSQTTNSGAVQVTTSALNGVYTITNAGGGNYLSIAAAVTDLNCKGAAGPVTFNVASGHTESISSEILLTATGTASAPIIFQGSGVNPKITRTDAGSNTTSTLGGLGDAIIRMNGNDYITFDKIDLTANNQGIEYGYYTHKTSGTNGSSNITIKNCVVTMQKGTSIFVTGLYISNGPTSTGSATGVTVTSSSGRNENIVLTGNTVQRSYVGILLRGASTSADQDAIVGNAGVGNLIQNFGGGSIDAAYGILAINQNNPTISYNTINNAGGGGTAQAEDLFGVSITGSTGNIIVNNNTITMNLSSSDFFNGYWIHVSTNANSLTVNNNIFAGTMFHPNTDYIIYNGGSTPNVNVTGNQTSGTISCSNAFGFLVGYQATGSPAVGVTTISNNNFSNINSTPGFYGIYNSSSSATQQVNITGNTISNITSGGLFSGIYYNTSFGNIANNIISNVSAGDVTYGIRAGNASTTGNTNIFSNSITDISGLEVTGILSAASGSGSSTNIYKNKICGLTSSTIRGLEIETGITTNIYNNNIGNLISTTSGGSSSVIGILNSGILTNSSTTVYYNTIYLNTAAHDITGIQHTGNSVATTNNLTLRNNIVYNNSIPSGSFGEAVAFYLSGSSLANFNSASNNNLFYAGVPSSIHLIYAGTSNIQLMADYKIYMNSIGAEQNSVTQNISFQSFSCGSPNFLKFDVSGSPLAESGAANIPGLTDDYIGTIRQGNPGYTGTGTAPDIGAWELEPVNSCSGSPAASSAQTTDAFPCNGENFTLDLNISFGVSFHSFQWEESVTGPSSGFSPIASATSPTLITNTTVTKWYRCAVTCISSGLTTTSVSVKITIATPLSGTYTINNSGGGNYTSFAAAISDLNCKGTSGPVTFNVAAGQVFVESSELVLTYSGSVSKPITFQRSGIGANPKIQHTGSLTFGYLDKIVVLSGVDYYSFNGIDFEQTGSSFDGTLVEIGIYITNTSPTAGANNNTFKNGVITLSNTIDDAVGVLVQSSYVPTSGTGTQSNNSFINMTIQNSFTGYMFSGGSNLFPDDGNKIDTESGGTSLITNLGNGSTGFGIEGVVVVSQTNFKIKNTEIIGMNPRLNQSVTGIYISGGTSNTGEISGNKIHNASGDGSMTGIDVFSADSVYVSGNQIYDLTTSGNTNYIKGIHLSDLDLTAHVCNNRIYNLTSTTTSTGFVIGIEAFSGTSYSIYNNMISDLEASTSLNTTGGTRGISGGNGGIIRLYFNTIYLNDIGGVFGYTSAGILNVGSSFDIRNNIIINKSNVSNGTRVAAIWKTTTSDNILESSNNNIYYAGIPDSKHLIFYDGTHQSQTVAEYSSLPFVYPGESHSHSEDVTFQPIVTGILRPNPSTNNFVESRGVEIAGFNTDFENTSRGSYPLSGQSGGCGLHPDRGADEGDFLCMICNGSNGGTAVAAKTIICEGDSSYITNSGYSDNVNNTFEWESSPAGANTWTGTGIDNPAFYHSGVITQSMDYRLRVQCPTNNSTAYSNIVTLIFIPYVAPFVTQSAGAICPAGGSITITAGGSFVSYTWSPSIGLSSTTSATVIASPALSTDYVVTATNSSGCTSTSSTSTFVCPAENNRGKDFWVMFNDNYDLSNVLTLIVSSEVNTSGVISGPSIAPIPFTVLAHEDTLIVLPASLSHHPIDTVSNRGVHVTAMDEITVYGLNKRSASTDAFLALPINALGSKYRILTYRNASTDASNSVEFGIVGVANGTIVSITPSVTTLTHIKGVPYNIELNEGETYELQNSTSNSADFTGTLITSTQPVGVFGAHSCATIPTTCLYCDYICEMLPPINTWGKKFGIVPLSLRTNGDQWRFLASEDNTSITINGVVLGPILDAGEFIELNLDSTGIVESTKPILVAQYARGSACSTNPGDPDMMLMPPLEQFLTDYTFTSFENFSDHFVNIIAPNSIVGSITLNGSAIPASSYIPLGTSGFSAAQISILLGTYHLSGSQPFAALTYGFGSDESYGYLTGQSYSPIALAKNISITPASSIGYYNTNQCWNALVTDEHNTPLPGVRVDFYVQGVNTIDPGFSNTNASGITTFCYTGPTGGKDSIHATQGSLSDTAIFNWLIGPVTLNAKLFIEGFYTGGGMMDNYGNGGCLFLAGTPGAQITDADSVLISVVDPGTMQIVNTKMGVLQTDGSISVTFGLPVAEGDIYFIRLKHRNTIETWSAAPVSLTLTTPYDFTSAQSQAYGSNMVQTSDLQGWAIFSGDVNQDGAIDGSDFLDLDVFIQNGDGGYVVGDLNGDAAVDGSDFLLLDPNIQLGTGAIIP